MSLFIVVYILLLLVIMPIIVVIGLAVMESGTEWNSCCNSSDGQGQGFVWTNLHSVSARELQCSEWKIKR